MAEPRGSHRTRSKAAPDWSAEESLILINEINAIESEWGDALPSYQKWQQIVENCNSLDVDRNLNQCRRKWDELFSEYRRVKTGSGANGSLHGELFDSIDQCVRAKGRRSGSEEAEEDEEIVGLAAAKLEVEEEKQAVMDTDPDSDPEAQGRVTKFFLETGSKKQKRRMKRQKRRIEKLNPWGYFTSPKVKLEESSNVNGKLESTNSKIESMPAERATVETKEQIMSTILRESAYQINAILECKIADDADYNLADLKDAEAVQMDLRKQADNLIIHLEKISRTLKDFSDLAEQCK